jgi:hypothetical protein
MRLGLFLIACLFALALITGDTKATAKQGCAGNSCAATASCSGSSVGCAGEARSRPVRSLLLGRRSLRRLFGARACGG